MAPVLMADGRELRRAARELAREANLELARLRRIRGASWRTARRIARTRARLALAAALLAAPLAEPVAARPPSFANPLPPFGPGTLLTIVSPGAADIDDDGDVDVFTGSGGDIVFFENTGKASAPAYGPAEHFPFGMTSVAGNATPTFADIDGDGDLDAFVGEGDGSTVFFENAGTPSGPAFAAPASNPFGLADVGYWSSPAFANLDGDGDLDAFVGTGEGNIIFFENTGTANAPAFVATAANPFGLADVGATAAPAFADLDGDGDLDALVGNELGVTNIFFNTGSANAPAFAAATTGLFGLVDVGIRAQPEFFDADGDGDLDALLGVYSGLIIPFTNTGTVAAPAFAPPAEFVFGPPALRGYSVPALADVDGDGDLDALVGTGYGDTIFFENTGAANAPAFAQAFVNPFGLADVGFNAAPALADLDGDGDLDAFLGEANGNTLLFENTAAASSPAFLPPATNPDGLANVGGQAAPDFADTDGDGDLDAFVGNSDGQTVFFANSGTPTAPAFSPPVTNPFGLADIGFDAVPRFVDLDGDGDLDAVVGTIYGGTLFFDNTGTASAPAFAAPPATNPFGLAAVGYPRLAPAFGDLDSDGDLDALLGRNNWVILFENLAALCPGAADPSCAAFPKATLSVNERKPGKEKLAAKLAKGPALAQADFGDPGVADGTAVAVCLYDDSTVQVAALEVDRAGESCGTPPCWKPVGKPPPDGQGFGYKDPAASAAGVRSLKLKGGGAGRSSLAVSASNKLSKGQTALPTGIAAALATTAEVTLQVHTSDAGCFSATLSEITRQESDLFKAR
jgi:hypothetical protein